MIRRHYVSFCLAAQLAVAASIHAPAAVAELAVPTASDMVARAELVLEGRFVGNEGNLRFRPSRAIKGDLGSRRPLRFGAAQETSWQTLDSFVASIKRQPCIVLAERADGRNSLNLPWAQYSIWPQGHDTDEFPGEDLSETREFVVALAGYESAGRADVDGMISLLLNDATTDRRYAAVAFLSSGLENVVDDRELRRAIVIAVGSKVMRQGDPDKWTLQGIANLSPHLPAGLAARYLLDGARTVEDSDAARIALSRARAVLLARKMIDRSVASQDERSLRAAYAGNENSLRILDANAALPLLDSSNERIRAEAEATLQSVLDRNARSPNQPGAVQPGSVNGDAVVSPPMGREYWEDRISRLESDAEG